MDFFNKAKEAISGGDSSSKEKDKKKDDSSIFSKAMEAAEKYHAKDKVVEFAQKRVAKREEDKHQAGYSEKKDKSIVDKAVQAAEDFLAKQGDPNKPKDNNVDKPEEHVEPARLRSRSSSSSSSSDGERRSQPARIPEVPRAEAGSYYSGNTAGTSNPSYPPSEEADVSGSFTRMNLGTNDVSSSSPGYPSPVEAERYPRYAADADSRRQYTPGASSHSASAGGYVGNASSDYNRSYPQEGSSFDSSAGPAGSRDSYPSGPSSGGYESYQEYWARQGNSANNPRQIYPSYPSGATGASYGYDERANMSGGAYGQGNASAPYGRYQGFSSSDHV